MAEPPEAAAEGLVTHLEVPAYDAELLAVIEALRQKGTEHFEGGFRILVDIQLHNGKRLITLHARQI